MAPIIHCVRHAQGYHNLTTANHSLPDPQLTPFGEEQCRALQKAFPYHANLDLIVASPLQRTLNTGLLSFEDTIHSRSLRVLALPELQETSDLPCDTGSDPDTLQRVYADRPFVDLELVQSGWNSKRGRWAASPAAVTARAAEARKWLAARPEKEIAVITHGGFLHHFTEDWTDSTKFEGTGWANTEFRSYTFDTRDPEKPHLVETPESRQRRRGDEKPLDASVKANLERTAPTQGKFPTRHLDVVPRAVKDIQAKLQAHRKDDILDGYGLR